MGTTSILGWPRRQPNCPCRDQPAGPLLTQPSPSLPPPEATGLCPMPRRQPPPWATGALQGGQPAVCSRGLSEPPVRLQQLPT